MTNNHGNNESSSQGGNLLFKLMKWTDGLWNKSNRSVTDVVTMTAMLGEQESLYNATYHNIDTLISGHGHGSSSSSSSSHHATTHSSPAHGHDSHSSSDSGSHEYHLSEYFERAVEMINTVAGVIVLVRGYPTPNPILNPHTNSNSTHSLQPAIIVM